MKKTAIYFVFVLTLCFALLGLGACYSTHEVRYKDAEKTDVIFDRCDSLVGFVDKKEKEMTISAITAVENGFLDLMKNSLISIAESDKSISKDEVKEYKSEYGGIELRYRTRRDLTATVAAKAGEFFFENLTFDAILMLYISEDALLIVPFLAKDYAAPAYLFTFDTHALSLFKNRL